MAVEDRTLTLHVGDVQLSSTRAWGAHAAPGYLMNVRLETHSQAQLGGPSICGVEPGGNNQIPQLTMHESLFHVTEYTVLCGPPPRPSRGDRASAGEGCAVDSNR